VSSLRLLKLNPRRRATVASVAALSMLVPLLGQSPASAAPAELPKDVSTVRIGLIKLGSALAAAAEQPALSDDLPLTDTSVRDVLSLDTAIGTLVDDALASDSDTTLDTLGDAFPDDGPLTVEEVPPLADAPAGSREWTMKVALKQARPVALTYKDDQLQFGTASLGGTVAATLDTTIRFRYDASALELRKFSIVGAPDLTTHVWTSKKGTDGGVDQVDIPAFKAVDGFVEVDGKGTATIDSTTVLALRDPNGRDQITTEDLEFSSASELFNTTTKPDADDVAMHIDLSTPMESSATGTVTVGARSDKAKGSYAEPVVQRESALKDLASLTRAQAISGFTQYTSALQAVEASVDQSFPLLDRSLTDLFSPANQLVDLLTEQATASIVCGAADTSPPSGAPRPGDVRYCQATTTSFEPKTGADIDWTSPDEGVKITGSSAGTLGRAPSKNVTVSGGDGFPTLRVAFTAQDGTKHVARSAVTSIQDLGQAIDKLGLDGTVDYDANKKSLQIAVREHGDDPSSDGTSVATGGNGNLAPLTGLSGLCQAVKNSAPRICKPTGDQRDGSTITPEEGAASVKVDGRTFAADFGIGLTKPVVPVAGEQAPADPTFYVVPGDDGVIYQVDKASAELTKDAQMVARIGFLQADVDVTDYSVSQSGKAASVSVPTAKVTLPSTKTVDDAVTVASLLTPTTDSSKAPSVTKGLSAKATLKVQDSLQTAKSDSRPIKSTGTVDASWTDLAPSALPKVTTGGDFDKLRLLDIVPARQSTMTAGSGKGLINDSSADFVKQFGLADVAAADRVVNRPLYDLGGEASSTICSQYLVIDAHQLKCTAGPLKDGVAAPGHPYVIEGDQNAMRDIVVEDLAAVLNTFTTPSDKLGADRTFPLVDVLPTEISAARDGLGKVIKDIQDQIDTDVSAPGTTSIPRVSSMQEFAKTFDTLMGEHVNGQDTEDKSGRELKFTLSTSGSGRLVLESALKTTGQRQAPLRIAVGDSDVKIYDDSNAVTKLPIKVASQARFVIGVDLADASSSVRADTGTSESITGVDGDLSGVRESLAGRPTDYGSARVTSGSKDAIQVGIGVDSVTSPAGSDETWIPITSLADKMEQKRSVDGGPQGCGAGAKSDKIAACLKLPLVSTPATDALDVALEADQSSGGGGGSMKPQPIAYRFLAEGLGALNSTLVDALDGDQTTADDALPMSLPLVGTDLDAGTDVPADVRTYVSAARAALAPVEKSVAETDKVSKLTSDLTAALGKLNTSADGKKLTSTSGTPVITCGTACTATSTVADVQNIEVPMSLTGKAPTTKDVPFHVGPIGSTIITDLTVPATASYDLQLTMGVARGKGSYVTLNHSTDDDPLLKVDVDATLGAYTKDRCSEWTRAGEWTKQVGSGLANSTIQPFASAATDKTECIDAYVGKFPSVMVDRRDGGARSTKLDATTVVNVTAPPATENGRIFVPALADKGTTFARDIKGTGKVSTYFESFAGKVGFFDVVGGIDYSWKDGAYLDPGVAYSKLKIDVGTLNDAVLPGFKKALAWTAPLNPAVDQLSKPIPVVSQLSELVGKGPTTLLTLMQSKDTPINLIINLLQLQNVAAYTPDTSIDLRDIGAGDIGGFKVAPYKTGVAGKCTETGTAAGKEFKRENGGKGDTGRCKLGNFDKMKQYVKGEKPPKDPEGLKIDKTVTTSPYISLPSVSLPVLQDTGQIFNLLQDTGDATMLYVDLGHAGISKQIVKNFGPFAVGPIPVMATIGGTVGFDGRFAFGFDTRGLSRKIEGMDSGHIAGFKSLIAQGTKPSLFSDGFYIDDLEKGADVPEIKLTFTVTAGAAISIGIVSAGISGGATLDLSLDAFDPNGDGKIYTDEFAGSATGPACAFNVSSGISFVLSFYFMIELVFYTVHESFDIVRSPRIKLFEFNCSVDEPVLATQRTIDGKNALVLTMGSERSNRKGFAEERAEKYTVRQVGAPKNGKIQLQVSAFNLVQNYEVPEGTVVRADAGDGSDTIRMYPMPAVTNDADGNAQMLGPDDTGYVAPKFTPDSVVTGGSESDTIETSDGDDTVAGDGGDDSIRTGLGDDVVTGGAGMDQVDGGQGQDRVSGGDGDDRVNGGPGADEVRGDAGKDVLDGGIGADPGGQFDISSANLIRPLLDAGDLVVGGDGPDSVAGGDGSDIVVGGQYDTAGATFADTGEVKVVGTSPTGQLLDVTVDKIATVTLPTTTEVGRQCASPGASGEVGPDVVTGGNDADVVIGGAGSDTLSGGGGADRVCGRAGDDVLDGDGTDVAEDLQGDDIVRGGPGRDRVYGSGGKDDLQGDDDDDLVRGGAGADTIAGGAGSDLLLGESGVDAVDGDNAAGKTEVAAATADATATGRSIVCSTSTSVVGGKIDLDGDLAGNDTGQLEGMSVVNGVVTTSTGAGFTGIVSDVVFDGGRVDLDGNGTIEARTKTKLGDTGSIPLAGITGAGGNGDCVLGGDEVDTRLAGGAGADYVDAGGGDDQNVFGGSGNDLVRGGDGNDLVHGDSGDDLVAGDAGDDILFGNADADVLRGGSGGDLLAGGSAGKGALDGRDEVFGDGGDDVVLGGNATLGRTDLDADKDPSPVRGVAVTLLDTPLTSDATPVDDLVYGGVGTDWVFGQNGDDKAYGGPGKDVVEGGPGSDRVQGDDGDDLLVGGSSTTGELTKDRTAEGTADGDDTVVGDDGVDGDDGSDVMVGDNARLQIDGSSIRSRWQRIRSDVSMTLFDVPLTEDAAPSVDASGGDTMSGGGKDDLVLGQSGDDTVDAGSGEDGVEGGAGSDTVNGGDGDDRILGGSWTAATSDEGDVLHGDAGADVLLGDNGTPATALSLWVNLHDAPAPGANGPAGVSGGDRITGGPGDDRMFGQGGDDDVSGEAGVDVLEGDAGADTLAGDEGDDVLTGGSSSRDGIISPDRTGAGQLDGHDALSGGSGDDVLAGDNARLDGTGLTRVDGTSLRSVLLFDLATATSRAPRGAGDADTLDGDEGRDLVFGQAGDDALTGGSGDDYLEGDDGADGLAGNGGEDDLVGGGSSRNGAIITVSGGSVDDRLLTAPTRLNDLTASGLLDGNDVLDGGDARDVLLGDNGRITRGGPLAILGGGASGPHAVRTVAMADSKPGVWSGSDQLAGGQGDDDLYGQFDSTGSRRAGQAYRGVPVRGDVLAGGAGDDAVVGDQGVDVPTPAAALGPVNRTIKDKRSFIRELVRPRRTLVRVVTLANARLGGDDVIVGDDGADSIHAGAGRDVINAGAGDDAVFAGDDADAVWGGAGHDRMFGGEGNDLLDVKRRARHTALWKVVAPTEDTDGLRRTTNGGDVLYGGAGSDGLQADEGDSGRKHRVQGDRLIDWSAKANAFKVCRTGRGTGKILDESSSSMVKALRDLATASGVVGSAEVAIPLRERITKFPGRPGFVCETR
jgi:Ca2+-binding RTX toxin-like protein